MVVVSMTLTRVGQTSSSHVHSSAGPGASQTASASAPCDRAAATRAGTAARTHTNTQLHPIHCHDTAKSYIPQNTIVRLQVSE